MALVIDTGVLYASMDRSDQAHRKCRLLLERAEEQLVLPAPILPEIDYFVSKNLGTGAMVALLRDIANRAFVVEELQSDDYVRVGALLDQYSDGKIGFVDASVLAVVERLGEDKVATLDRRHFDILRPRHRNTLLLLP